MTLAARGRLAAVLTTLLAWALCACLLANPSFAQREAAAIDYDAWQELAEDAEASLEEGDLGIGALDALRREIATERESFLAAQDINAARIQTLQSQLDALGAPPAEGEGPESEEIASRREQLGRQLEELRRPVVAAEEAYMLANGLVAEIDSQIRDAYARQLLAREPSPLNPTIWITAPQALGDAFARLARETSTALGDPERLRRAINSLGIAIPLAIIGVLLILRSRWWVRLFAGWALSQSRRGEGVLSFFLSIGQIILPLAGVFLVTRAVDLTGIPGPIGQRYVDALFFMAVPIILAKWLMLRLFPCDRDPGGPLLLSIAMQERLRLYGNALGVVIAAAIAIQTIAQVEDRSDVSISVLLYIPRMLAALLLYKIGRTSLLASSSPDADGGEHRILYSFLRGLGRLTMFAGIAGAALATLGYVNATEAILAPAAMTLALTGLLVLLQKLVYDVYALLTGTPEGETDALAPVLIGFALALAALPVYALIWGARWTDLLEIWTRFRAGYAIGETRISPTDFLWFALVFVLGYALTRFVQSILRSSILPKTSLDVGGRNAIVSGLGYVGIIAAMIVAITSAGINLSSLAIVAGALSVGIGFGLQNVVSNFVSGIILLIERPISEGDWIQVGDQMGYVRGISVRSTRIETFDRTDVIVPNADLVSGTVTNWTRGNLVGRVIVPVGVAYGTDTRKVEAILSEIAEAHPMVVLNPRPAILLMGFGADSLDFEIRAFVRDINFKMQVQSDMNHEVNRRFSEEGIEIPFAQRVVWLRNPDDAAEPVASPRAHGSPLVDRGEPSDESEGSEGR